MANSEVSRLKFNDTTYEIADELARESVGTALAEVASVEAKADAYNTALSGRITNLENSSGAVLVAKTRTAMTDTNKIYVYTGTTTTASGVTYTKGHWYYHNGSKWTDGGEYNQNLDAIDATLTQSNKGADAKVTGDRLTAAETDISTLRGTIANEYAIQTYAVGDYCYHDGLLYRCNTEISVGEEWTSSHWTAVDVMPELNNLKNDLKSRFNGKKLSIIGDSIDTFDEAGYKIDGYRMYYPALGVTDVNQTWWKRVINNSGMVLEVNASWSGSRVTDTASDATYPDFYDRVSVIGSPDVIFITLGSNDSSYSVELGDYDFTTEYTNLSESTFRTAYIKGLKALKALHPSAEIVCISEKMNTSYRESIEYIARSLGVEYIDVSDYVGSSGVHPGIIGMEQIASLVLYPTNSGLWEEHYPADAMVTGQRISDNESSLLNVSKILNNTKSEFTIKYISSWGNVKSFCKGLTLEPQTYYYFNFKFDQAPSGSTYVYLRNASGTDLNYRQCKDLNDVSFSYKPTSLLQGCHVDIASNSDSGLCKLIITTSDTDKISELENVANSYAEEDFLYLSRFSPFKIGSNFYDAYYDYKYAVCSKNVITAKSDWYIEIDEGYQFRLTIVSDEGTILRNVDWRKKNYYLKEGENFVVSIMKYPLDTSDNADLTYVKHVKIKNMYNINWFYATKYCNSLVGGKKIDLSGEEVSGSSYYQVYKYVNPKFKRIKAIISNTSTEILEISMYTTTTPSSTGLMQTYSVYQESPYWGASNQVHTLYADVPEDCKLVCINSRRLLNDDTPFTPGIYVDDLSSMLINEWNQSKFTATILNGYRYICHIFAEKIGTGNFYIPCQSIEYITIAHRLGYKMIELNCHPTATPGKYIVMHGTSGTIGDELVAKDGSDISKLNISDVTYETFLNDYVYNSSEEKYRTHVTFLEDALILCRQYSIIPLLSWGDYDMIDVVRKYVGDNFVLLVYDDYYVQKRIFKGFIQRYSRPWKSVQEINDFYESTDCRIMYGFDDESARTKSTQELLDTISAVHSNGGLIGVAGVYQSVETNQKLKELGIDYNATGYEVESFDVGNKLNLSDNGTYTDFYTGGTLLDGILTLSDGEYLSSRDTGSYFLSKGMLCIRFSGNLILNMGDYIYNINITSDGYKSMEFSTLFINRDLNFTVQSVGESKIYSCVYKASVC